MLYLHGIHFLHEISCVPLDMYLVSNLYAAIRNLYYSNAYFAEIMANLSDLHFLRFHNQPPLIGSLEFKVFKFNDVKSFRITYKNFSVVATKLLTCSTDFLKASFSPSVSFNSMTFSTPFLLSLTGTPTK